MTAYKKIYLTIILVITITLLASAGMFFYKSLVKNLRQEITADLRKEIKKLVALELKQHTAGTGEIPQQGQERQNLARDLRPGIRELLKQELWSYEAGGEAKGGVAQEEDVTQEKGIAQIIQPDISAGKPKDKALERALIEKGGMLLAKGQLQIEPSFTTAHFSSHRINIQGFAILPVLIIGNITTETIKRDIFIEALSLKYGLWKNLQVEAKVPYKYQFDRVTDNVGAETTRSDSGIGDIELGLSRQIAYERGIIPDLVFAVSAKTPTGKDPYNRPIGLGTGHWAIRSSLIAAKSSDPAVMFGSISYTRNFERDITDYGKVKPGDTIGYSLGSAIALSYQASINFQFEHYITSKLKKDGELQNGTFLNAASLKYGFNWAVSENWSVNFSVSHGLTADAPDYVVEVRFPYTF